MLQPSRNIISWPFLSLAFFAALMIVTDRQTLGADKTPFKPLAGWWSGSGFLILKGGEKEAIKCRATYFVKKNGKFVEQNLRCASRDSKISAKGKLSHANGKLSGSWNETVYKVGGQVTGTVKGGRFNLSIQGPDFSGSMFFSVSGRSQSVDLRPNNSDITRIQINLKKG